MMRSETDLVAWKEEVERVTPFLKIVLRDPKVSSIHDMYVLLIHISFEEIKQSNHR